MGIKVEPVQLCDSGTYSLAVLYAYHFVVGLHSFSKANDIVVIRYGNLHVKI